MNKIAPTYEKIIKQLCGSREVQFVMIEDYVPGGYHAGHWRCIMQYPKKDMLAVLAIACAADDRVLGLSSLVSVQHGLHVLLLDFDLKDGEHDSIKSFFPVVKDIVQDLWLEHSLPGYAIFLNSGNGIHVVGTELISWEAYKKILTLRCYYLDDNFCAWSLARGYGTLRITKGGNKKRQPTLLA